MKSLARIIRKAKHVFIIGNGGSYANAQHIANDLLSCGVRAFTLDPATLTAFANDHGYDKAFGKWLSTVAEHEDVLIALSGSGNSKNISYACRIAKNHFMTVIGITGAYEPHPKLAGQAHHVVRRGKDMQAAEDYQLVFGHSIMRALRYVRPENRKPPS